MSNPYQGLPDHHFWRRSVSACEPHLFDPVVATRFTVSPGDRVATAGSCFAQHISRRLQQAGFNYFVTEAGAHLDPEERSARNYGLFSARFGNIYTAAQLRQLFDEAFGRRVPRETCLRRADGRFVDIFRQQVEPAGFADAQAVAADRAAHLHAVRAMFEQCDVFIFTLGLTEAWCGRADGSVYPTAPGVVAGAFDADEHAFVNFGVEQVQADLRGFLDGIKAVNPGVRVILTVSPVPLVATFEDRHVLVATTYSKAVLRVAAETARAAYEWVDYFPSYEIITGSITGGLYYEPDHREVNHLGVAHAMRCFADNFLEGGSVEGAAIGVGRDAGVVCDEATLDAVRF